MTQPPAGWYPAPDNPDEQRYWDGAQWLDIPPPPPRSEDEPPVRRNRGWSKRAIGVVAGGVLLVAIGAGGLVLYNQHTERVAALEAEEARSSEFSNAASACSIALRHFELSDDNDTVVFKSVTKPNYATGEQIMCFLRELDAPASMESKLEQTRSLDGTREESWRDLEAEWTFHPDAGLNLIVERSSELDAE